MYDILTVLNAIDLYNIHNSYKKVSKLTNYIDKLLLIGLKNIKIN